MTCTPQPAMIQKSVTQILRCVAPNVVMQHRLTTKCTPITKNALRAR